MIRLVALLGATAVLAAAGCGGDDEPSRDEFISKAKAICVTADKKRDAIEASVSEEKFNEDPALLRRHNDVARDAIAKLRALEAPEEERAGLQKVIAAADRGVAAMDDLIPALRAKDIKAQDRATMASQIAADDVRVAVGVTDLAGCEGLGPARG